MTTTTSLSTPHAPYHYDIATLLSLRATALPPPRQQRARFYSLGIAIPSSLRQARINDPLVSHSQYENTTHLSLIAFHLCRDLINTLLITLAAFRLCVVTINNILVDKQPVASANNVCASIYHDSAMHYQNGTQTYVKKAITYNTGKTGNKSNAAVSKCHLQCALMNVRSMSNKTAPIADFIIANNLKMLFLTETWQQNDLVDAAVFSEACPPDYKFFSIPRHNRRGEV